MVLTEVPGNLEEVLLVLEKGREVLKEIQFVFLKFWTFLCKD